MADPPHSFSMLNRLLEEISWEGASVRKYRRGGARLENVLTAEVLMPLDFLPRKRFLGAVLAAAHGADAARGQVIADVDDLVVELLPEQLTIAAPAGTTGSERVVQPDAVLTGASTLTLIEAKAVHGGRFSSEQLAREFVALRQAAGERTSLLLVILGSPPPVTVTGRGRMGIMDAVTCALGAVLAYASHPDVAHDQATIEDSVAWITWSEIRSVVLANATDPQTSDATAGTVRRLVDSLVNGVDRHSSPAPRAKSLTDCSPQKPS